MKNNYGNNINLSLTVDEETLSPVVSINFEDEHTVNVKGNYTDLKSLDEKVNNEIVKYLRIKKLNKIKKCIQMNF